MLFKDLYGEAQHWLERVWTELLELTPYAYGDYHRFMRLQQESEEKSYFSDDSSEGESNPTMQRESEARKLVLQGLLPSIRIHWALDVQTSPQALILHNKPVIYTKLSTNIMTALQGKVAWRKVSSLVFDASPSPAAPQSTLNMFSSVGISEDDVRHIDLREAIKMCLPYLYHLKHRWAGDSASDWGYLVSFLSHTVQFPGVLQRKYIALCSAQGAGKGAAHCSVGALELRLHPAQGRPCRALQRSPRVEDLRVLRRAAVKEV